MAAPVPRPPQPTKAILIVSSADELKKLALETNGIAMSDPATREVCFTNSLRVWF